VEKIDTTIFFAEQYYSSLAIGGWAHEAVCTNRLAQQSHAAWARVQAAPPGRERRIKLLHAWGLYGAQVGRVLTSPVEFALDLAAGTGRMRGLPAQGELSHSPMRHLRAFLNHPFDTGLLGLQSAYFLGKHALIAGSVGSVVGVVLGAVTWPMVGWRRRQRFDTYVRQSHQTCALWAGCAGAVVGNCLIMAPHNLLLMQLTRLATALPKLAGYVAGYALGLVVGVGHVAWEATLPPLRALSCARPTDTAHCMA
jgi:hypothetical protein